MKYLLCGALAAIALALPVRAQDKPKADEKPSVQQQFQDIVKEFREAQQPLVKEFQGAKDDAERAAIRAKFPKIGAPFAAKAIKLAEENAKDIASLQCLNFAMQVGRSDRAAELLIEHHGERPELATLISQLAGQLTDNAAFTKLLELAATKGKTKGLQGTAGLALAKIYFTQSEGEKDPKKAAELGTKAEAQASTVMKDFADVESGEEKLGVAAKKLLFKIQNLAIGKTAPEVVSRDLDEKETKLSQYRGKVVVLDIWATWCGPCRAMIPHEREMVEKLKGKPFVLISISADDEKKTLKDFLEKEKMPWVHWWEGRRATGILTDWGVEFFPTIYVIDAKGVIRYKGIRGKELEEAVDKLVKEADPKG